MLLSQNEHYTGEVVVVSDGDTITVLTTDFERIKVRFYGVDSPEKGQPYGDQAKNFLNGVLYGKTVEVEVKDIDRYSRYVGLVKLNGEMVNKLMVEAGYAWTYPYYCKDKSVCQVFKSSEDKARREKKGLWEDPSPVAPWEWRRSKNSS
jgi:endonuclease YncB( thermonuclease family)